MYLLHLSFTRFRSFAEDVSSSARPARRELPSLTIPLASHRTVYYSDALSKAVPGFVDRNPVFFSWFSPFCLSPKKLLVDNNGKRMINKDSQDMTTCFCLFGFFVFQPPSLVKSLSSFCGINQQRQICSPKRFGSLSLSLRRNKKQTTTNDRKTLTAAGVGKEDWLIQIVHACSSALSLWKAFLYYR